MKKHLLIPLFISLIAALPSLTGLTSGAEDISGTWNFSVDLDSGGHGEPTFVFKQEADKLTGTYNGPLGEYKVTGTVTGVKAVFGFEFPSKDGEAGKATYTGTIESPTKMTGTVEFSDGNGSERGKWVAGRTTKR
jgi:hypothetical protein